MGGALLVSRPTSPGKDVLFTKLMQFLEQCQISQDCSIYGCPEKIRCERWFNEVCKISSQHALSLGEFQAALIKFSKIQPGLF